MKRGGYPSHLDAELKLPHRDEIYPKISSLPEGTIFQQSSLDLTPEQALDFASLRGYDYLHLADGWLVGIVETEILRRAPDVKHVLRSYEETFGVKLRETGDRIAWRRGLKRFEPIRGYQFYTTGPDHRMMMGHMKLAFINAPASFFDESLLSDIALIALDTCKDKESYKEILEWTKSNPSWMEKLLLAKDQLSALDESYSSEESEKSEGFTPPTKEAIELLNLLLFETNKK